MVSEVQSDLYVPTKEFSTVIHLTHYFLDQNAHEILPSITLKGRESLAGIRAKCNRLVPGQRPPSTIVFTSSF